MLNVYSWSAHFITNDDLSPIVNITIGLVYYKNGESIIISLDDEKNKIWSFKNTNGNKTIKFLNNGLRGIQDEDKIILYRWDKTDEIDININYNKPIITFDNYLYECSVDIYEKCLFKDIDGIDKIDINKLLSFKD